MEAVASLAKVGKPTVYRWWPDRHAVAMAALMEGDDERPRRKRTQGSLEALRAQLEAIVERFKSPSGRHVAALIAAADANTELSKAFRNHFVLARRDEGLALLKDAVERGELRADLDLEVAVDVVYGPLFFRLLTGHAPLTASFVDRLVERR